MYVVDGSIDEAVWEDVRYGAPDSKVIVRFWCRR
jgi:hypothetical protein